MATEADEDAQHYTSIVIVLISLMSPALLSVQ